MVTVIKLAMAITSVPPLSSAKSPTCRIANTLHVRSTAITVWACSVTNNQNITYIASSLSRKNCPPKTFYPRIKFLKVN